MSIIFSGPKLSHYCRSTTPVAARKEGVLDPDFNFSWLSSTARPMFGADQAKMFSWLCDEDWEHMGGRSWPCFTHSALEDDRMGLPAGLRGNP